ncbi:MAG: ribonuclease P protein component [Clostridiales bacterium]|nr:ribonuclease P protein component [Clostridiales bacterium]
MKGVSLKFNYEFSRAFRRGSFATGRYLTVHAFKRQKGIRHNMTPIPGNLIRTGFCANKKQLGAVGRNRARRLMRESYRKLCPGLKEGYDLIFTLKNCKEIPCYRDIADEMKSHLIKLGVLDREFIDQDGRKAAD